jgi:hypothetical protein
MDSNYEAFYAGLKGLTNQQVIDEIYKKVGEYCQLVGDVPNSTELFKEKLRILFDKVALLGPEKMFHHKS